MTYAPGAYGEGTAFTAEKLHGTALILSAGGYTGDVYCLGCEQLLKRGAATDAKGHTGGSSNVLLWIALLFVSGSVMVGIKVFNRKKKHLMK